MYQVYTGAMGARGSLRSLELESSRVLCKSKRPSKLPGRFSGTSATSQGTLQSREWFALGSGFSTGKLSLQSLVWCIANTCMVHYKHMHDALLVEHSRVKDRDTEWFTESWLGERPGEAASCQALL